MLAATETEASTSSKPETKGPETVVPSISQQKGIMLPLGNERYLVYSKFQGVRPGTHSRVQAQKRISACEQGGHLHDADAFRGTSLSPSTN